MRIVVDTITVSRGEDTVIADLSTQVEARQALVVRGPNGAGKSTLLRAIAGLLPVDAGAIRLEKVPAEFGEAGLADLCHYLGHENAMKTAFSVQENLSFWQEAVGQPHLPVDEALAMVGLGGLDAVPFAHLSTGQRRRVAIARLLVSYRPIWLLDEPTAGLDAASESQFSALMRAHLEDDGLIVAATHVPLDLPGAQVLDLTGPLL